MRCVYGGCKGCLTTEVIPKAQICCWGALLSTDTSHILFMATKAEKEAQEKAAAEAARLEEEKNRDKEPTPEELKAASDKVEADRIAKAEAKKAAAEAAKDTPESEKMYSKSEVLSFIKQAVAEARKKEEMGIDDSLDEEDPYKIKKLRLPRFQNKFIFAFKNTNTDPYFPENVIQAFDVWNDQTKRNDAWVTVIFEDDSQLTVPLYTVLNKSQKVLVDIVEVIAKDTSYSAGRVERAEIKDYSRTGTGTFIKAKVTQADYSYKIKLPDGKEVIVGKEVVNW